jgi:hypothetical protein
MSLPTVDTPDSSGDVAMGILCLSNGTTDTPPIDHFPGRCFVLQKSTQPSNAEFINDGVNTLCDESPIQEIVWRFEQEIAVDLPADPTDQIRLWYKHTWRQPEGVGGDPGLEMGEIWASTGATQVDFDADIVEFCDGGGGPTIPGGGGGDPMPGGGDPGDTPTVGGGDGSYAPGGDDSLPGSGFLEQAPRIRQQSQRAASDNPKRARPIIPQRDGDWLIYRIPAGTYFSWLNLNETATLRARTLDVCLVDIHITATRNVNRKRDWQRSPVSVTNAQGFGLIRARKQENWLFIGEPQYSINVWQGFRAERTPILSQSRTLPTRVNVDISKDIRVDMNHQRSTYRVGSYELHVRVVD